MTAWWLSPLYHWDIQWVSAAICYMALLCDVWPSSHKHVENRQHLNLSYVSRHAEGFGDEDKAIVSDKRLIGKSCMWHARLFTFSHCQNLCVWTYKQAVSSMHVCGVTECWHVFFLCFLTAHTLIIYVQYWCWRKPNMWPITFQFVAHWKIEVL